MSVRSRDNEAGFTMIPVVLGLSLVIALSIVAVAAVSGDIHLNRHDLDQKRAYEAAKAGINDYIFHLHEETDYWTQCDDVSKPVDDAVNPVGSTAERRLVPGSSSAKDPQYAIEMLPAEGQSEHSQCSTESPGASMLEPSGPLKGTFRIRSTGFAGKAKVAIVATFKPATFLDYVYFTQRETLDPVSYGYANPSPQLTGANSQCSKPLQERDAQGNPLPLSVAGRNSAPIPNAGGKYCTVISFAGNDEINGPMHTNDLFVICSSPQLGRGPADQIEVSGPPKGWFSTREVPPNSQWDCSGSSADFLGTYTANSPVINPPPSNSALKDIAGLKFKGQVRICLNGTTITVGAGQTCTDSIQYSGPIPGNGVVYVEHDGECSISYSPFNLTYEENEDTKKCGNAFVHGEYSGQLTLGTENDIVVDGDLTHADEGVMGLIANNFVRIYHPVDFRENWKTGALECDGNNWSTPTNVDIDAAILAIKHSFIVDNYDCGSSLGTLTVNGAIAMKYRGPVGLIGGSGYAKSYNYDDRLRYLQPPSFIEPAESDWVIGRQTISSVSSG